MRRGHQPEGGHGGGSGFQPVRPTRVHEAVADQLRQTILAGGYEAGERLPHERELIARFEVSRTAIRQAMQLLEQQGLVDVRVGSGGGCFVAGVDFAPIRESFVNLFALRGVDADEFLAAKAEIEPAVFAAAANRIRPEEVAELEANLLDCYEAVAAGDDETVYQRVHDFHRIVSRATSNRILELVVAALVDVADHIPEFRGQPTGGWEGVLQDHEEILEGLRRRDSEGVRRTAGRHASSVETAFSPRNRPPKP